MTALFIILIVFAVAFLFALFLGKPSKDEAMKKTKIPDLENYETFWRK